MGCLAKRVYPQYELSSEEKTALTEIDERIPNNEFMCPFCKEAPEIINFHSDNNKIEILCKNCGKVDNFKFYDLNKICQGCQGKNQNENEELIYCYQCKKVFCNNCKSGHLNHSFTEIKKENSLYNYGEKATYFCDDCQENIHQKESSYSHYKHKLKNINGLYDDYLKYRDIIIKKNKKLVNAIRLNNLIIKSYEINNNNYFYIKSLINVGKSIEKENSWNSQQIEFVNELIKKNKEVFKEYLEELKKKNIDLKREEKYLDLNNKNLEDEDFKLITMVNFYQLKRIDVSYNQIKNIDSFKKMYLPFLEYLNMSNNEIENIEPLTEIKSKKLKELFLHKNKIKKIDSLFVNQFILEILRIDGNEINYESEDYKKLKDKYNNTIIYDIVANPPISKQKNYPDFSGQGLGNKIINDLYVFFDDKKEENSIINLILKNNDIEDVSRLSKIDFPCLQKLDLSINKIKNINFLYEMKSENLKELYLDNNYINDICLLSKINPSLKSKFQKLEIISLKNNNLSQFSLKEEKKEIQEKLKTEGINVIF